MNDKKLKERKTRYKKLYKELKKLYPNAELALKYKTAWQLLVAVQLSAQSRDSKVNEITKTLFKKYKTPNDFANASLDDLQKEVNGVLYYRNKARNLQNAAKKIIDLHKSRLPKTMEEMLNLDGVARKTANVVLGTLWGIKEGIVVDTHMIRFAMRFDLSDYRDAVRVERDLMEIIPKKDWYQISYMVVDYGRECGNPRNKQLHEGDILVKVYKKAKNFWPKY